MIRAKPVPKDVQIILHNERHDWFYGTVRLLGWARLGNLTVVKYSVTKTGDELARLHGGSWTENRVVLYDGSRQLGNFII